MIIMSFMQSMSSMLVLQPTVHIQPYDMKSLNATPGLRHTGHLSSALEQDADMTTTGGSVAYLLPACCTLTRPHSLFCGVIRA